MLNCGVVAEPLQLGAASLGQRLQPRIKGNLARPVEETAKKLILGMPRALECRHLVVKIDHQHVISGAATIVVGDARRQDAGMGPVEVGMMTLHVNVSLSYQTDHDLIMAVLVAGVDPAIR